MKKDFSATYSYDAIGRPCSIQRYGVTGIDGSTEKFGLLDGLTYRYDGALPSSISRESEALPFFGQIGATGTTLGYNKAGLLLTDTGRGIERTVYNLLGLPSEIEISPGRFAIRKFEKRLYSMSGSLISVSEFIDGYPAPVLTGKRTYIDRFTFACGSDGVDTLMRVDFPGGYFDSAGVHWMLPDAIGSVELVIDGNGNVEQHTGYYPYGEPWREPAGQPYLFGGKERRRFAGLGDYDFHARFLTTSTALWQAPDLHAGNRPWLSPFVFCSANPIRRIDPTGMDDVLRRSQPLTPPGIKLFDDEEEYKRNAALNATQNDNTETNSKNQQNDNSENKEAVSDKERTGVEVTAIIVNSAATPISKTGTTIEKVCEQATGLEGTKAVDAYYGKFGGNLTRFARGVSVIGFAINTYIIANIGIDYAKAGGSHPGVYIKLTFDEAANAYGSFGGLPGLAVSVGYNALEYGSNGFGTDEIINDQLQKKQ